LWRRHVNVKQKTRSHSSKQNSSQISPYWTSTLLGGQVTAIDPESPITTPFSMTVAFVSLSISAQTPNTHLLHSLTRYKDFVCSCWFVARAVCCLWMQGECTKDEPTTDSAPLHASKREEDIISENYWKEVKPVGLLWEGGRGLYKLWHWAPSSCTALASTSYYIHLYQPLHQLVLDLLWQWLVRCGPGWTGFVCSSSSACCCRGLWSEVGSSRSIIRGAEACLRTAWAELLRWGNDTLHVCFVSYITYLQFDSIVLCLS